MTCLTDMTCGEFLAELGSKNPTPGGGGASALVGATAAALMTMLAYLTVGKKKDPELETELTEIIVRSEKLRLELTDLADADVKVFKAFMEFYKLPKTTEAEAQKRKLYLADAALRAADVPFRIGEKSLEVARLAVRVVEFGNPNAISDGVVAAIMARSALRSAFCNVRINLKLINDVEYVEHTQACMLKMEAEAQQLEEQANALGAKYL